MDGWMVDKEKKVDKVGRWQEDWELSGFNLEQRLETEA